MDLKKLTLILIVACCVISHIAWYATSKVIAGKEIPDEKILSEYESRLFKRMKIDVDTSIIEQKYNEANGFRIHIDIFSVKNGAPTIVFIPGTSAYTRAYIEFMYKMYKSGFNVIGVDPRGHGRSSGPRGDYTINEIVDDAVAVVDYARKRFKSKVAIAGSSQGGIAAFYAAARDDSIAAVVCHNIADLNGKDNLDLAPFTIPQWMIPFVQCTMDIYESYSIPIWLYLDLSKDLLKDGTDAASYITNDPLCYSWISLRAMSSLLKTDLAKPVEKIKVPVMLIHSGKDHIFPQDYVEGIFNRLTCKKEYLLLKDEEHLVMTNNVPQLIGPVSTWLRAVMK